MITLFFYAAQAGLALLSRWIGGRWYIGYFLGGLIYGLYNEVAFEFCWNYSDLLAPFIWKHVPLIVILGWGVATMLALVISNRVQEWLKITNFWKTKAIDVLAFCAIGLPTELSMSKLGLWTYNFPIQGELWMQIYGYVFVGFLVSCAGRTIQNQLDKKNTTAETPAKN